MPNGHYANPTRRNRFSLCLVRFTLSSLHRVRPPPRRANFCFLPFLPLFGGLRVHPLQQPVNRALSDMKFTGDDVETLSSPVKAENLLCGDLGTGASADPALGSGTFQTGLGSFTDSDGFLLCEGREERNKHVTKDAGRVDVFFAVTAVTDAHLAQSIEVFHRLKGTFATQAVEAPEDQQIPPVRGSFFEDLPQSLSAIFALAARRSFLEDPYHRPVLLDGERLQLAELVSSVLPLVLRDPAIDGDPHKSSLAGRT